MRNRIALHIAPLLVWACSAVACSSSSSVPNRDAAAPFLDVVDASGLDAEQVQEGGLSNTSDPCTAVNCGMGTCSTTFGYVQCVCMPGAGNAGGLAPCVSCQSSLQPFNVDLQTAKVTFSLTRDGSPVDWSNGRFLLSDASGRNSIAIFGAKPERVVPVGRYRARFLDGADATLPWYEGVFYSAVLGDVVITPETKTVALAVPAVVLAKVQAPFPLRDLTVWSESTGTFTVPPRMAGSQFGVETTAGKAGQFSFRGPPGRYSIISNKAIRDSLNIDLLSFAASFFLPTADGTDATKWATFDVPKEGTDSPIPVAIEAHKVVVKVAVQAGEPLCSNKCRFSLVSSRGYYPTILDPTSKEHVAFVPTDSYRLMVSTNLPLGEQVYLPLGIYKVDGDQVLEETMSWIKVKGTTSVNGVQVSRATGSSKPVTLVDFLNGMPPVVDFPLMSVMASPEGTFEAWLPPGLKVVPQLTVVTAEGADIRQRGNGASFSTDTSQYNLDVQAKVVTVKPVAPAGTVLRQVTLNDAFQSSFTFKEATTRQMSLGTYDVGVSTSVARFSHVSTVAVASSTDELSISPAGRFVSGAVNANAGAIELSFYRQSPIDTDLPSRDFSGSITTDAEGKFSGLWLASGQYFFNGDLGFLGCMIVE